MMIDERLEKNSEYNPNIIRLIVEVKTSTKNVRGHHREYWRHTHTSTIVEGKNTSIRFNIDFPGPANPSSAI